MKQATLHVAPGMSAAGSMRMAARMDGRDDEVIGLPDSLSFGPIDYVDPKTRSAWVEDVLATTGTMWWKKVSSSGTGFSRQRSRASCGSRAVARRNTRHFLKACGA